MAEQTFSEVNEAALQSYVFYVYDPVNDVFRAMGDDSSNALPTFAAISNERIEPVALYTQLSDGSFEPFGV